MRPSFDISFFWRKEGGSGSNKANSTLCSTSMLWIDRSFSFCGKIGKLHAGMFECRFTLLSDLALKSTYDWGRGMFVMLCWRIHVEVWTRTPRIIKISVLEYFAAIYSYALDNSESIGGIDSFLMDRIWKVDIMTCEGKCPSWRCLVPHLKLP